jgi:L-alanine-DL-glutamate epimerase-like enolase superfamily enzyme
MEMETLWQRMLDSCVWWGRAGDGASVLGAIETALWDLRGQILEKPCYQLLGDRHHSAIPVYASLGPSAENEETLRRLVDRIQEAGFDAFKIGLQFGLMGENRFYTPHGDELLRKVEQTLGQLRRYVGNNLMVGMDGHMGGIPEPIGREDALRVARVLERYSVAFFEEPLSYLDPAGYAWLREQVEIPISGGESLSLVAGFKTFLDMNALDIVQPDVNWVGGLRQGADVIRLAESHGLAAMPHAWCGGPGIMANIHLAFAFQNVARLEMPLVLTDLQRETLIEPPIISNGAIKAPTVPGLGITFDPSIAERFPYTEGLVERGSGLMGFR